MVEITSFEKLKKNVVKTAVVLASGAGALTLTGCSTEAQQQPEERGQIVTIDNKDSDGTILFPAEAAFEDVVNAALEQADTLGIADEQSRNLLVKASEDATREAIANESDESLVGNRVRVIVETDGDGFPTVAVIRQK